MDPTRFDALARSLCQVRGRRQLVTLLTTLPLIGVLTGLTLDEAEAERPRQRLQRRKAQHRRKQRNRKRQNNGNGGNGGGNNNGNKNHTGGKGNRPGPGGCQPNGNTCQQNSDCCGGNCFAQVCSNPPNQCSGTNCPNTATGCCPVDGCCLPPANQCNPAGLCCAPNCGGRQCGTDGCGNTGTCGTCANGQTCIATGQCGGPVSCSPQSCPNGCCAASGSCQPGTSVGSCGANGMLCSVCLPGQTCSAEGACQGTPICTAQTCPFGCCDTNNVCQPGRNASFCGTNGEACVTCLPEEFCNPVSRQCTNEPGCNENTCDGCCDEAGTCQPGTTKTACGTGGITCATCRFANDVCTDGICTCTPNCLNRDCGDNGCDGTCGTCGGSSNTCCSGHCRNLQLDGENCGACGHRCAFPATCNAGICCTTLEPQRELRCGPGSEGNMPCCSATVPCCHPLLCGPAGSNVQGLCVEPCLRIGEHCLTGEVNACCGVCEKNDPNCSTPTCDGTCRNP